VLARPNPGGATASALSGISCPTSTTCFGVGNAGYGDSGRTRTLVTRWNGASWSVAPSADASGASTDDALSAVSCTSATFCVAVGAASHQKTSRTLVEQCSGKSWVVVPSPNPTAVSVLTAGSCATTTSCTAVGYQRTPYKGFVEQWNGKSWALASARVPTAGITFLWGVACPTATTCFAVGRHTLPPGTTGPTSTLVLRWDGRHWSVPAGSETDGVELEAIACRSATNCELVGAYVSDPRRPYVAQWDGVSPLAAPRSSEQSP
jgi:hypothetical protein